MSQDEILAILKYKRLTRREIQEITDLAQQAVSNSLKQLVKWGEVEMGHSNGIPIYSLKIKKKKAGKASLPPK